MKSSIWRSVFDIENKKKLIKDLEQEVLLPGFWDDSQKAAEKSKKLSDLKQEVEDIEQFKKEINDLFEIKKEFGGDESMTIEIEKRVEELSKKIEKEQFKIFLSGKFDRNNAILEISSGAGGRDAEDFVTMLLRMYEKYAEKKGYSVKHISFSYGEGGGPEGRVGIKDVSVEISGSYCYGFLKKEKGIHRLVRKSPFSSDDLRHTSFASVDVYPKVDGENGDIQINDKDIRVDTFRSSGPGGQYVNKTESAVRITHIPTGTVVASQNERLQGENRRTAMSILKSKLQQIAEEEKKKNMQKEKGELSSASWGNQIRNYVLHPYKTVKDLRTEVETSNVESVLNGDIDLFIEALVKQK